jgi:hypothetical protein
MLNVTEICVSYFFHHKSFRVVLLCQQVGRSIVLLGRELIMGVETATVVIFIFSVERIPHIHH